MQQGSIDLELHVYNVVNMRIKDVLDQGTVGVTRVMLSLVASWCNSSKKGTGLHGLS